MAALYERLSHASNQTLSIPNFIEIDEIKEAELLSYSPVRDIHEQLREQ